MGSVGETFTECFTEYVRFVLCMSSSPPDRPLTDFHASNIGAPASRRCSCCRTQQGTLLFGSRGATRGVQGRCAASLLWRCSRWQCPLDRSLAAGSKPCRAAAGSRHTCASPWDVCETGASPESPSTATWASSVRISGLISPSLRLQPDVVLSGMCHCGWWQRTPGTVQMQDASLKGFSESRRARCSR